MRSLAAALVFLAWAAAPAAPQIDYGSLWSKATPFHTFLENVRSRQEQWRSRFADAAIDAAAINEARALPGRRRILAIAEDSTVTEVLAILRRTSPEVK